MSRESRSVYYRYSGRLPLSSRVSYVARSQIFKLFMAVMKPTPQTSVLDIGVTSDCAFRESNFFEQFYPYKNQIVCVGTENGAHLRTLYPGLKFTQVRPGERLPFADRQFDVVFSNAVVEHAGSTDDQRAFVLEACRVGRRVFIVTPNRLFPVEHHTGIPVLHYLPKTLYRRLLGITWLAYWSDEQHLNSLTRRELQALFPCCYSVHVKLVGLGCGNFKSNIVAYTAAEAA